MAKISKLTKEQESKIQSYYDKWEAYGKRTTTLDRTEVTKAIKYFYSLIGKKEPKVIILSSPMACQLACNYLSLKPSKLYSQLNSQLYRQLNSQLNSQLDSQLQKMKKRHYVRSYQNVLHYSGFYCFYDFLLNEIFPKEKKKFKEFSNVINSIKELHYYIMFEDFVFISDFPEELHFEDKKLHNVEGPAVKYRDGCSIYSSQGNPWNEEEIKRFFHNKDFSSTVENLINS